MQPPISGDFMTLVRIAALFFSVLMVALVAPSQPASSAVSDTWSGCCGVTPWPPSPGMTGPGMTGNGMMGDGMMGRGMMGNGQGSAARHRAGMMGGIPSYYRTMTNPLPKTGETIERGAKVYAENCASCHGATGAGDGEAAHGLSPRPANLAWLSRMPMVQWDPYMYWTVADGGVPFGTAMPVFKDVLSPKDIWAVIAYIQAHLPQKAN